jgi:hypothetical protein
LQTIRRPLKDRILVRGKKFTVDGTDEV